MITDLQKASMLKRISAYILDAILLCVLAVGFGWMVSSMLDFDAHAQNLSDAYARYETEYGVSFGITIDDYNAMTEGERANYDAAQNALTSDEDALYAYNMVVNQAMVILSLGIFFAYVLLELVIPLLLKNGQTLGKKCFSIGVIRVDGVRLSNFSLFVRTVLGKYTIETMVPVLLLLLSFLGILNIGIWILFLGGIVQLALLLFTANKTPIHDLLSGTVVVDIASQMIFQTPADLIAYKQRIHADAVKKKPY